MNPTRSGVFGPIIQYEIDLIKLRRLVSMQRKRRLEENIKRKELDRWFPRMLKQGPWGSKTDPVPLTGPPSLPMPVEVAKYETLLPFFTHIAQGGSVQKSTPHCAYDSLEIEEPYYHTPALEFERGVVYADGRMDLCKMVVGPDHIDVLMQCLKTNEFVTHFLLGNNIIGPYGALRIAEFCKKYPNQIDTWNLAGNCIHSASFHLLVNEWVRSTSVTNVSPEPQFTGYM